MNTKYKYNIIKGEADPFTDIIHSDGSFEAHIPGQLVQFNNKSYNVVGLPTKAQHGEVFVIDLAQI